MTFDPLGGESWYGGDLLAEAFPPPVEDFLALAAAHWEQGLVTDPRLFPLVNCARVLRVDVTEICEDGWLEWHVFDATNALAPPPAPRP
jgi:hypothetical protein